MNWSIMMLKKNIIYMKIKSLLYCQRGGQQCCLFERETHVSICQVLARILDGNMPIHTSSSTKHKSSPWETQKNKIHFIDLSLCCYCYYSFTCCWHGDHNNQWKLCCCIMMANIVQSTLLFKQKKRPCFTLLVLCAEMVLPWQRSKAIFDVKQHQAFNNKYFFFFHSLVDWTIFHFLSWPKKQNKKKAYSLLNNILAVNWLQHEVCNNDPLDHFLDMSRIWFL